jgi:hypothetical protein
MQRQAFQYATPGIPIRAATVRERLSGEIPKTLRHPRPWSRLTHYAAHSMFDGV